METRSKALKRKLEETEQELKEERTKILHLRSKVEYLKRDNAEEKHYRLFYFENWKAKIKRYNELEEEAGDLLNEFPDIRYYGQDECPICMYSKAEVAIRPFFTCCKYETCGKCFIKLDLCPNCRTPKLKKQK